MIADLAQNKSPSVLNDISHINFTQLTFLILSGNSMESVEKLLGVEMPHLHELYLGNFPHRKTKIASDKSEPWERLNGLPLKSSIHVNASLFSWELRLWSEGSGWRVSAWAYRFFALCLFQWSRYVRRFFPSSQTSNLMFAITLYFSFYSCTQMNKFSIKRSLKKIFEQRYRKGILIYWFKPSYFLLTH